MPTTRRHSLLPLFTLVGLMACSSSGESGGVGGEGGATSSTGGSSGGASTTAAGGSTTATSVPATGGKSTPASTANTGGIPETGGSTPSYTTATGGTPDNGGTTAAGGSTPTGGTPATGGKTSSGGAAGGSGGTPVSGGRGGSVGGAAGSIGGTPTAGSGSSPPPPPPPPPGTIPTGYPAPTADNYAKCQKVAVGTNDACGGQPSGNICIECLFGGSTYNPSETAATADGTSGAGNYVVTVTLGGAAAGDTYISAESTRGMLQSVTTKPGDSLTYAFVVNVRAMEGQPRHAGGPGGYPGLDLFFSGTNPQVSAVGYALATAATKPIMIYIASDSTTCDQTGGAFGGWGQMLPEYFGPPIGVANYANSGASSSSFAFFGDISSRWVTGDWFIIQFGHNDKGVADSTVQANLTTRVKAAQAAGVNPIIVSPPARAGGYPIGDQSSLHAAAAKAAAAATSVPFIDLTALSVAWYNTLGSSGAVMKFHANGTDGTHTNLAGGEKLAGLVVQSIKDQKIGLAQYLRQ